MERKINCLLILSCIAFGIFIIVNMFTKKSNIEKAVEDMEYTEYMEYIKKIENMGKFKKSPSISYSTQRKIDQNRYRSNLIKKHSKDLKTIVDYLDY